MADDKKANEQEESAEPKGTSDAVDEAPPGDGDSKEARRARRLANLGGGGNAHVLKHRAAKRARQSAVITHEEMAVELSQLLRDKRTQPAYKAQIAKVLVDMLGYSQKGAEERDASQPTHDIRELILQLDRAEGGRFFCDNDDCTRPLIGEYVRIELDSDLREQAEAAAKERTATGDGGDPPIRDPEIDKH